MRLAAFISPFKSTRLWSVLLVGAALFFGFRATNKYIAHQHLPWKTIDLHAPMGFATKTQLLRLGLGSKETCVVMVERDAIDTDFTRLEIKKTDEGCGWNVGLLVTRNNDITFRPAQINTQCPMAAASHIWLREVGSIARAIFGSDLTRVHHYGSYSCRNIAGTSRLSEHAFANAWDVSGFELADGRLISVRADWDGSESRRKFLRAARDEACNLFRVVLSPDYNADHADHFHLDMGPSSSCR